MQLAPLSVLVHPAPVIQAVGDIAGLLDFIQHQTRANGVHGAGGDVIHFTRLHRDLAHQGFHRPALFGGLAQVILRDAVLKPDDQLRARFRVQDDPGFVLAQFAVVLPGIVIIRVHLDGQLFLRVNQLEQQGKRLLDLAAQEGAAVLLNQLGQGTAVLIPAFMAGDGGQFQALASLRAGAFFVVQMA